MPDLSKEQQDAVATMEGPMLVIAGAGSGKTRVVTFRIARMIEQGISPSAILGVTFTNKAADEMKRRIEAMVHSSVLICTFHSLGARILRECAGWIDYPKSFTIYDEEDSLKAIKLVLEELQINQKVLDPKAVRGAISRAKNALLGPDDSDFSDSIDRRFPQIYALYQKQLRSCEALDFDDLLFRTVRLLKENPDVLERYHQRWSYLMVDEFQDTNAAQYEMIRLLARKHENLCVVGDPDQSIYSWRGAQVRNILEFQRDYPETKVVRLTQNYRSRQSILEAANALIRQNCQRHAKDLWSDRGKGDKVQLYRAMSESDEAYYVARTIEQQIFEKQIPLNEIAIFYRTNQQSRIFEDVLATHRIPYQIVGGLSFYQRREIKDCIAWMRMVHSGADYLSFARTVNLPKRGLGTASLEKIRQTSQEHALPILDCIQQIAGGTLGKLSARQRSGLQSYLAILEQLKKESQGLSISGLMMRIIEQTGYLDFIKEEKETYEDRKGNLDALVGKATEWEDATVEPSLEKFLEELTLRSSVDEMDNQTDRIKLMTLHNSKGLEFDLVFLTGLEEYGLPHANANEEPDKIEEERRLCYVGMTRAKEKLVLTHAYSRRQWGTEMPRRPSRFLNEIPEKLLEEAGKKTRLKKERFIDEWDEPTRFIDEPSPKASITITKKEKPPQQEVFSEGDCVTHPNFGKGVIEKVSHSSLGLTYHIAFQKYNRSKMLVAEYAPLSRL